jgi:DegV family protein with EDD domain
VAQIAIVTDTVSCLPDELRQAYSISAVPLHVNFGAESYLSTELSVEEFYRRLPMANPLPTTSTPSVGEYQAFYRDAAERGA